MKNGKKLVVNTAICDMRAATEEGLSAYSLITINSAMVLLTPEVQAMLPELPLKINCADINCVPREAECAVYNGPHTIKASNILPKEHSLMIANGRLLVEPGTEEILRRYDSIVVNGQLICAQSVAHCMTTAKVNGKNMVYPDDAAVMKSPLTIDRVFTLRARNVRYFVPGVLTALDPLTAPELLAEKGASFLAERAVVAEGLLEGMLPLLPEDCDIQVVPDGTRYLHEDLDMDELTRYRYGTKLYVDGDLNIEKEMDLSWVEFLEVRRDVNLPASKVEAICAVARIHGEIRPQEEIIGCRIHDRGEVTISDLAEAVAVMDCAVVRLSPELVPGEIKEKLTIRDCGNVLCTDAQRQAVETVSEDVGEICRPEDYEARREGISTINCAQYRF